MNSSLITYTNLTNHNSGKRKHIIDRITPHCIVGQMTAKQCCDYFATTDRRCSSNYVIGRNGDIGLSVEEDNCSWCSSSTANDQRAVTIECASETKSPYEMTDTVYKTLVKLCIDICKRNKKTKLLWIDNKDKALAYVPDKHEMLITVHRWFSNKSCPGNWLYSRLGKLAEEVTNELIAEEAQKYETYFCVQLGAYSIYKNAEKMLNRLKEVGFTNAYITTKVVKK